MQTLGKPMKGGYHRPTPVNRRDSRPLESTAKNSSALRGIRIVLLQKLVDDCQVLAELPEPQETCPAEVGILWYKTHDVGSPLTLEHVLRLMEKCIAKK